MFQRKHSGWVRPAVAALVALCSLEAAGCEALSARPHGCVYVSNCGSGVGLGLTLTAAEPEPRPTRVERAADWTRDLAPLFASVDLDVGESTTVELPDGSKVDVTLVDLKETHDEVRNAVRRAEVTVEIAGKRRTLVSATYHLPVDLGVAQVDCPITKGYTSNARSNPWRLEKSARLRIWPSRSPWVRRGTLGLPLEDRWLASATQMANEPTYVDGVESPAARKIYYHNGLDFGAAERMSVVLAVADGVVVAAGGEKLPDYRSEARPDCVTLEDRRGWRWGYAHLSVIEPGIKPGAVLRKGDRIGLVGKEGTAGGWSHLHLGFWRPTGTGRYLACDAWPLMWQVALAERGRKVVALARPHHLLWTGDTVQLDGSRSWSADGKLRSYQWTFTDGTTAQGPTVERTYEKAGVYSEVLTVTDAEGRADRDFAIVQVIDRDHPDRLPPGIHAVFYPTRDLRPGQAVTFKVRSFGTTHGDEVWDFGDGTPPVSVRSDGNVNHYAPDGYAVAEHAFEKPGDYIVTVRRSNAEGMEAVAHLQVPVGEQKESRRVPGDKE